MCAHNTADTPLVSVAMVIYRPDPGYLREALASILGQSLRQFEVVIVEDPSDCSGRDVVAAFPDPRVRYFLNPSRTCLVDQRNRALAEARAEFVAVLDGDDIAEPLRLEKQLRFLRNHRAVSVVGSQIRVIDSAGTPRGFRRFPLRHEEIVRAMTRVVPLNQSTVMLQKSALQAVGGYQATSDGPAEDYHLWSRLAQDGVRFANLPEPLVQYRIHPGQIKARYTRRTIRAVLEVKERYWARAMGFRARVRMLAERWLLRLPEPVVLGLLLWMQYRDRISLNGARAAAALGGLREGSIVPLHDGPRLAHSRRASDVVP